MSQNDIAGLQMKLYVCMFITGDEENSFRGLKITKDGKFMYIRDSEFLKIFDVSSLKVYENIKTFVLDYLRHVGLIIFTLVFSCYVCIYLVHILWSRTTPNKE